MATACCFIGVVSARWVPDGSRRSSSGGRRDEGPSETGWPGVEKRLKTGSGEDMELVDPEVARLAAEARLLADLVTALRDSDDMTQTLQTIVEKLAAGLGVERCHLLLRDENGGLFRVVVESRPLELPSVLGRGVEAHDPDVAEVLRGGQVVVADNSARPASFPRPISQEARNLAFVLTPLRHRGDT